MIFSRNMFRRRPGRLKASLARLQRRFQAFLDLLESNNTVLNLMSEMEQKARGPIPLDINYISSALGRVREGTADIIEKMIELGGRGYEGLLGRHQAISARIERTMPSARPTDPDDYTIPFSRLDLSRVWSVGGKNARVGEMMSLGLPVPQGFAISAWGYKHFIDQNRLEDRINRLLGSLDIRSYDQLARTSDEIRAMIRQSPVPEDLARAMRQSSEELARTTGSPNLALRSSAIGEDMYFSFAGQYASILNVRPEQVVDCYREVLAGKFTPKAIYYFLDHGFSQADLPMAVGCVSMIDSTKSGVIYTRDPVNPVEDCLVINSIRGLGKYLVDGTLDPDWFRVSREDGAVIDSHISHKPVMLIALEVGGTTEADVPRVLADRPSLSADEIRLLADYALRIEEHYGCPQDIEWAIDSGGRAFVLQARPLVVMGEPMDRGDPDSPDLRLVADGGVTICPGAGFGEVYKASNAADLAEVPEGAVLVAPHPFPGLITAMGKVSAIVTELGGAASHMAAIAREYGVPSLAGVETAGELRAGEEVTVDATHARIYAGKLPALVEARRWASRMSGDSYMHRLLKDVLAWVSPLNLIHPNSPEFVIERCETFHDITRFCHQKAMEEMFIRAKGARKEEKAALVMKTEIPVEVRVVYIDRDPWDLHRDGTVSQDEIDSPPMKAFWDGVREEGWPVGPAPGAMGERISAVHTGQGGSRGSFIEKIFAILGREYMILSLRMGYHFTTVEAMCTADPGRNYIRMQFKDGGSSLERRSRRVNLLVEVLTRMGLESVSKGDFLDTMIAYQESGAMLEKLRLMGRLTILTKQLDMALSNDAITRWYTNDILNKLGLGRG